MLSAERLAGLCDFTNGSIAGRPVTTRRLSDCRDAFADQRACDAILRTGDPVLYTVSTLAPADGPGQLHCGFGMLFPGRVGDEYYCTRGHSHERMEAAEVYVGVRGTGLMLLQGEDGACITADLAQNSVVYVPGHTAHRTVNTGSTPLAYIGITPADAGHDYGAIRTKNFQSVVVNRGGAPALLPRNAFLQWLEQSQTP